MLKMILRILLILPLICDIDGRKRYVTEKEKNEPKVHLSTFGYLQCGYIFVNVSLLSFHPTDPKFYKYLYGFALEKDRGVCGSGGIPHRSGEELCKLMPNAQKYPNSDLIATFLFDFDASRLIATTVRNKNDSLDISNGSYSRQAAYCGYRRVQYKMKTDADNVRERRRREAGVENDVIKYIPFTNKSSNAVMFDISMKKEEDEGQYTLHFVRCLVNASEAPMPDEIHTYNLSLNLVELNPGPNYLPAGEIALPTFYACMSFVYGAIGLFWIIFLCRHDETVFKIHYLMFFLVLLKTLSLMFHSVDYHFIAKEGSPMQTFAVLFYITYLTKGALLFSTLALIGSGWAFIKPILSDREKKVFLLVIPLQVLANVAYIITETSEEGGSQYLHWRGVFILVDILCCVAIMYPVVWSVKHLQSAAMTDGKAAISLLKLRLFRQFYIMIVCYFYFTRIIAWLLKAGLSFRFCWIHEVFFEGATVVFFVVTAYKFRPGSDNPYLQLPSDEEYDYEEEEMDEIVLQSGNAEGLTKLSHNSSNGVKPTV